jgi:hypothetical protein
VVVVVVVVVAAAVAAAAGVRAFGWRACLPPPCAGVLCVCVCVLITPRTHMWAGS